MQVVKMSEHGLTEALVGLSKSYNVKPNIETAHKLANKDGGHNVFLEQIQCWFEVDAPRYWWQQFDRYRVGTTRQSESTMHTLLKKPLESSDFEGGLCWVHLFYLNWLRKRKRFVRLKQVLPESFLQSRVVTINYKSLRNIVRQREKHKLQEWRVFCQCVRVSIEHQEWL